MIKPSQPDNKPTTTGREVENQKPLNLDKLNPARTESGPGEACKTTEQAKGKRIGTKTGPTRRKRGKQGPANLLDALDGER